MIIKKTTDAATVFLGMIVFIASVYSVAHAMDKSKLLLSSSQVAVPPTMRTPPVSLCADPAGSLVLTKILTAGTASITMQATICNKGSADYVGQSPLDASFYVITWHPPRTAAQESDWKTISHIPVSAKLAKGECRTITQHYTIPGVTTWGHTVAPGAGRQVVKELGFQIQKQYSLQPGVGFSAKENCSMGNDSAYETLLYMEEL